MAKSKVDLSKLELGKAKPLVKEKVVSGADSTVKIDEVAVQKIHQSDEVKEPLARLNTKTEKQEPIVRITVDVSKSMHKNIKTKIVQLDLTIRDYIIQLIEKDLK